MDLKPGWVDRIDWKQERSERPLPRGLFGATTISTPDEHESGVIHARAVKAEEDAAFKFYDPHALTD